MHEMPNSSHVGQTEGSGPSKGIMQTVDMLNWTKVTQMMTSMLVCWTFGLRKPSDESATTSVRLHWHILATMYDEVPDYCMQHAVNVLLCHIYNLGLRFITASWIIYFTCF